MVVFRPAPLGLVRPEWADRVPAPAYDALSAAERRQFRVDHQDSYLNVTLAPEDEPVGSPRSQPQLLDAGRRALERLLEQGAFHLSSEPTVCLYRIADAHHAQVGIVGEVPVSEYDRGTVRIHEEVRPQRVEMLAEHMAVVGAVSSPVALAIRPSDELSAWIDAVMANPPDLDFQDDGDGDGDEVGDHDGPGRLHQTVWVVRDPEQIAAACALVASQTTYIIDGHHRAAASSLAANRDERVDSMLVALFPTETLTLLGFNRWVREVPPDIAERLRDRFGPLEAEDEQPEVALGTVGVYLDGAWYRVELGTKPGEFDAVAVRSEILQPLCGIESSADERLANVAGDQPIASLIEKVDAFGGMAIVIAPIEMGAFLEAADRGVVLPPKSTYFVPKVRSGVFLLSLT